MTKPKCTCGGELIQEDGFPFCSRCHKTYVPSPQEVGIPAPEPPETPLEREFSADNPKTEILQAALRKLGESQ
jgi:hypothetical protein